MSIDNNNFIKYFFYNKSEYFSLFLNFVHKIFIRNEKSLINFKQKSIVIFKSKLSK